VTRTIDEMSSKIADSTSSFLDKNQIAMKAAGAVLTAAQLRKKGKKKKKGSSKRAERSQYVDDEEF
jgi:hypothetical protein